jgi:hypothetical protein
VKIRKLDPMEELKIENINLRLTILQIQANKLGLDKEEALSKEALRLKCSPSKWRFDEGMKGFIELPPKMPSPTPVAEMAKVEKVNERPRSENDLFKLSGSNKQESKE